MKQWHLRFVISALLLLSVILGACATPATGSDGAAMSDSGDADEMAGRCPTTQPRSRSSAMWRADLAV